MRDEIVQAARGMPREALATAELCNRCLGRLFAKVGRGFSNAERGESIREAIGLPRPSPCSLCQGLMDELEALTALVLKTLEGWEFHTFLIGTRIPPDVAEREESLWTTLGVQTYEPMKAEFNREIGKRVEARTDHEVDFEHPDIVAIVDPAYHHVDLQVASLLIRGRYRKLQRGIPQTRWPCSHCWGKGCERCGFTGKMYPTSVEEIIAGPAMEQSGGTDHSFHGMGREDIDALMLGEGRPFVLEVKNPRRRTLDLMSMARAVAAGGAVEVSELRPAAPGDIPALKEDRCDKSYRIAAEMSPSVALGKLKEGVASLEASEILQRTPARVSHRRADRVRARKIREAKVLSYDGTTAEILLRAEAGTYVKELMHGDEGRTKPSLAGILGTGVRVKELDVLRVHDEV